MESTWESHLPLARDLCFFSVRIRWERVRKRLTVGLASQFLLGGHGLTKRAPIIVNIKPNTVIAAENMRDVRLPQAWNYGQFSSQSFNLRKSLGYAPRAGPEYLLLLSYHARRLATVHWSAGWHLI